MEDTELIKGCQKGKRQAQEGLYKHFFAYGMSISLRFSSNSEDAKEILNDAYVKIFTKIHLYNTDSPFKPWFRQIIVRTAIDHYRSAISRDPAKGADEPTAQIEGDLSSLDSLEAQEILGLLAKLPENLRLTFVLFEIEGYTHKEIGEQLGIGESSSRSNLTRAKQQLQQLLKKHYPHEYAR